MTYERRPVADILNDPEFWRDVQRLQMTPMEVLGLYWGYSPQDPVVQVVAYYETHLRATERQVAILDRMTDDQADTINFQRREIDRMLSLGFRVPTGAWEPQINWGDDADPAPLYGAAAP